MIADFFTKPLQGRQFYKLRDQVMNVDPSSKLKEDDDNGNESNKTQDGSDVDPGPEGLDEVIDFEDGSRI